MERKYIISSIIEVLGDRLFNYIQTHIYKGNEVIIINKFGDEQRVIKTIEDLEEYKRYILDNIDDI